MDSEWETVSSESASDSTKAMAQNSRRRRTRRPSKKPAKDGVCTVVPPPVKPSKPARPPPPPRPVGPYLQEVKSYREIHETDRIVEAFAVKIPPGSGTTIAKILQNKAGSPGEKLLRQIHDATHLRRFVRRNMLPAYIRSTVTPEELDKGLKSRTDIGRLYFLACLATTMSMDDLIEIMGPYIRPTWPDDEIQVRRVLVNLSPPLTEEAAARDTQEYWPTNYKKNNPFGPQNATLTAAKDDLKPVVAKHMALARRVAAEGKAAGLGPGIGTVIATKDHKIVAVACDARHADCSNPNPCSSSDVGNPMCHSVLRAISMVGRHRRAIDTSRIRVRPEEETETFGGWAMTDLEGKMNQETVLEPGGYLCLNLDAYITHEPCIMCSMALLHSRFARVIIGKRSHTRGGLIADKERGYGLGWREELNWRFITFEWKDDERQIEAEDAGNEADNEIEAEGYHP